MGLILTNKIQFQLFKITISVDSETLNNAS